MVCATIPFLSWLRVASRWSCPRYFSWKNRLLQSRPMKQIICLASVCSPSPATVITRIIVSLVGNSLEFSSKPSFPRTTEVYRFKLLTTFPLSRGKYGKCWEIGLQSSAPKDPGSDLTTKNSQLRMIAKWGNHSKHTPNSHSKFFLAFWSQMASVAGSSMPWTKGTH